MHYGNGTRQQAAGGAWGAHPVSKVVDADGKPLVVYHGTGADFSVFDRKKSGSHTREVDARKGFFLSSSPEIASEYAEEAGANGGANIMPAYVSLQNPLVIDEGGRDYDPERFRDYIDQAKEQGHDGVLLRNTGDGMFKNGRTGDTVIAFRPEQIKSATGNNGNFDPEDPDILNFGADDWAAIKKRGLQAAHNALTHPGKMSLWDKTVGTMRHISERYPAFKPVYDAAQQFIDDVASLANTAANVAPRLIPRVDSLRDMFKKPISVDDNKAIAKALFEGTLDWGRDQHGKAMPMDELRAKYAGLNVHQKAEVLLAAGKVHPQVMAMWRGQKIEQFETLIHNKFESAILKPGTEFSEKELKEFFNLNGEQISLYKEARATVAKSLDITARAEMMRHLGHDFDHLRAQVFDAPSLSDAWKLLDDELESRAREIPDSRDLMADKMFQLRSTVDKVQDLLKHGYMPLSRFGKYTLEVIDQNGERVYFGLFEREADSNRMALQMRNVYKGAKVTQGTMNDEKYKLFAGITPETAELFGNMLGLDEEGQDAKSKAFQEYLRMAKNNHSALKRLIHRKGTAGYSEDVGRVLASFVYSNARLAATGLNAGRMESAIHRLNTEHKEQGELGKIAMKLREYIQDPQEEGMWLRGMLLGVGACTTETAPGNRRRAAPGGLIRYGCSTAQLLNTRC